MSLISSPLISPLTRGSEIGDFGHLTLPRSEYLAHPEIHEWTRPLIGGQELLRGHHRYVLFFYDDPSSPSSPAGWTENPFIADRLERVRKARSKKLADRPDLYFRLYPKPDDALIIPQVTSGARKWIPVGRVSHSAVINGKAFHTPWNPALFGLLSSSIHMIWTRLTAGRLKGDYSYSSLTTYNTLPPPTIQDQESILELARLGDDLFSIRVLDGRTLAEIYKPGADSRPVMNAHQRIDRCVDRMYETRAEDRLETLLKLYQRLVSMDFHDQIWYNQ